MLPLVETQQSRLLGARTLYEIVVQLREDGGVHVSTTNYAGSGPLRSEVIYDLLRFASEPFGRVAHQRERLGTRRQIVPVPTGVFL